MAESRSFDSAWKLILEGFLRPLIGAFAPALESACARGVEFLDKELQPIARADEGGVRVVDTLVRLGPESDPSFLHIEVQTQSVSRFPDRMFWYQLRLMERYQRLVPGLVIYADGSDSAPVSGHSLQDPATGVSSSISWLAVKLRHLDLEWLASYDAALAFLVGAHLRSLATEPDNERRYAARRELSLEVLRRDWSGETALRVLSCLERMFPLPTDLERTFSAELTKERTVETPLFLKFYAEEIRGELEAEVREKVEAELRNTIESEVRAELTKERDVETPLFLKFYAEEIRGELEAEVREKVEAELRSTIEAEAQSARALAEERAEAMLIGELREQLAEQLLIRFPDRESDLLSRLSELTTRDALRALGRRFAASLSWDELWAT